MSGRRPRHHLLSLLAFGAALAACNPASAAGGVVDVVAGPEDEERATRLVAELTAMSLKARLVTTETKGSSAVIRFLLRNRVAIFCCAEDRAERRTEVVHHADAEVLALRTAERLATMGLGRGVVEERAPAAPPPPRWVPWLTLRAGPAVASPPLRSRLPGSSPGLSSSFALSLAPDGPFVVDMGVALPLLPSEARFGSSGLRVRQTVWHLSGGLHRAWGKTDFGATLGFAYAHASFEVDRGVSIDLLGNHRLGPFASLWASHPLTRALSLFTDLSAVYTAQPSPLRTNEARTPNVSGGVALLSVGVSYRLLRQVNLVYRWVSRWRLGRPLPDRAHRSQRSGGLPPCSDSPVVRCSVQRSSR